MGWLTEHGLKTLQSSGTLTSRSCLALLWDPCRSRLACKYWYGQHVCLRQTIVPYIGGPCESETASTGSNSKHAPPFVHRHCVNGQPLSHVRPRPFLQYLATGHASETHSVKQHPHSTYAGMEGLGAEFPRTHETSESLNTTPPVLARKVHRQTRKPLSPLRAPTSPSSPVPPLSPPLPSRSANRTEDKPTTYLQPNTRHNPP